VRVCLISNQIAAWGKIGGFGTATRALGAGLARQGHEVHAVVPRQRGSDQPAEATLDGITVHAMSSSSTMFSGQIFRQIDAQVYHSQEPTIATRWAQRAAPRAIHVVTCRDPRGMYDHGVELRYTNWKRRAIFPVTWYYEASPWVKASVRRADAVFSPVECLIPRIKHLYGKDVPAHFLPSPVDLPERPPRKDEQPLVLFVGRWDRRKRIERFFELAGAMPQMHFAAIGRAHDAAYDRRLRRQYGQLPNLEMPGFVSRFDSPGLGDWYARSWILVNTSAREGLPYTFLEAGAFGCAVLSSLNPGGFADQFGIYVSDDDYEKGLRSLLADDLWRSKGQSAAEYVRGTFSEENSVRLHLRAYEQLLDRGSIE